jgi:hypothetical protein
LTVDFLRYIGWSSFRKFIAIDGDDGIVRNFLSTHGTKQGPTFCDPDTVGFGLDFDRQAVFITKNGTFEGKLHDY